MSYVSDLAAQSRFRLPASRLARRGSRGLLVNQFFQFLAGFKVGNAFRGDADRLAGFRIAAAASAAFADAKTPEAAQLDLFAMIQTFDYAFKDYFDQALRVLLGEFSSVGYVIDKISFSHAIHLA